MPKALTRSSMVEQGTLPPRCSFESPLVESCLRCGVPSSSSFASSASAAGVSAAIAADAATAAFTTVDVATAAAAAAPNFSQFLLDNIWKSPYTFAGGLLRPPAGSSGLRPPSQRSHPPPHPTVVDVSKPFFVDHFRERVHLAALLERHKFFPAWCCVLLTILPLLFLMRSSAVRPPAVRGRCPSHTVPLEQLLRGRFMA